MNYNYNQVVVPSLQHVAMVKISVELWKQADINKTLDANHGEIPALWNDLEKNVTAKAFNIVLLPEGLVKLKLAFVINLVRSEIWRWIRDHRSIFGPTRTVELLCRLKWTPLGLINEEETAKVLVKNDTVSLGERYIIACMYCLEEQVRQLRPLCSVDSVTSSCSGLNCFIRQLVKYWTLVARDFVDRDYASYLFKRLPFCGNVAAVKYLVRNLRSDEKGMLLVRMAQVLAKSCCFSLCPLNEKDLTKNHLFPVLCCLLSEMSDEQQVELFQTDARLTILVCFLDLPWANFFKVTLKRVYVFLSEEEYFEILLQIVSNEVNGKFDPTGNFSLFEWFWENSSDSHKTYVADTRLEDLLRRLIVKLDDFRFSQVVLNHAPAAAKRKCMFSVSGDSICDHLMNRNDWNTLKALVIHCFDSEVDVVKFRDGLRRRMRIVEVRYGAARSVIRKVQILPEAVPDGTEPLADDSVQWKTFSQSVDAVLEIKRRQGGLK